MEPTTVVIALGFVALVVTAIVASNRDAEGKKGINENLQLLIELNTPKPKLAPLSHRDFRWNKPSIDWAELQKEVSADYFKDFDWDVIRAGEMYVDGGTSANEPNIAHPSLLIGSQKVLGNAMAIAFATQSEGHTTLLDVIVPCLQVLPNGVIVTEVTIKNMGQAVKMAGPMQSAYADAISDCIQAGILPIDAVEDICFIGQGFIYPFADNDERVYHNNYVAVVHCIVKAVTGKPTPQEVAEANGDHPFRGCKRAIKPAKRWLSKKGGEAVAEGSSSTACNLNATDS